jgi:hypothetical protein
MFAVFNSRTLDPPFLVAPMTDDKDENTAFSGEELGHHLKAYLDTKAKVFSLSLSVLCMFQTTAPTFFTSRGSLWLFSLVSLYTGGSTVSTAFPAHYKFQRISNSPSDIWSEMHWWSHLLRRRVP